VTPLARLLSAIADRLHPDTDDQAAALGLTVTYRPDGTRTVHHPGLPAITAAYRSRVLACPDPVDRLFIDPAVLTQAAIEQAAHPARVPATTVRSLP
jgi:hypothetical protein